MHSADTALSLLFRKLHPLLEDVAHALDRQVPARDLERLHLKLLKARMTVVEALEGLEAESAELGEALEELASNLTPSGETFQQSLVLTQLCLEEAPNTFLPLLPAAEATAPWMRRLTAFQALVQDPAQGAEQRWKRVDPDLGESPMDDD